MTQRKMIGEMTREELEQAAVDLAASADVMAARGFCKWTIEDRDKRVCAHGAMDVAVSGTTDSDWNSDNRYTRASMVAVELLSDEESGSFENRQLAHWNNRPERTQDEVEALLLEGASLALSEAAVRS